MNILRVLDISERGDREAPVGLSLRQEEMGEEDRFNSVLSRIAGSMNGAAAALDSEEGATGGLDTTVPDGRLRRSGVGAAEIPDGDLAGGAVNARLVAERQVRMLPTGLEGSREFPHAVYEPGIQRRVLTGSSPINAEVAAPDAVLVELSASAAPAVAEIGSPDLLPQVLDAADDEPAALPGAGNDPSLAVAASGFRVADSDRAPPASIAGEPPDRHIELIPLHGDHAPGEAEVGQRPPPPELPRMTVISREKHFVPAQHSDSVRFALPLSNPQPDRPVSQGKGQTADPDTLVVPAKGQTADPDVPAVPTKEEIVRPDASPRNDRFAQTEDLPSAPIEPESRPQYQESSVPRNLPAGGVPAVVVTAVSSTEGRATPTDNGAGANEDLTPRIATLPGLSRATVIAEEKPSEPASRFDPANPAASDSEPEPPRGPVAGPAAVSPEAAARSPRPALDTPTPSAIVPRAMPQSPERDDRGHRPVGVVPAAAAAPSTESTVIPPGIASGLGQDILQRISGAVVEAAASAASPAAAPAATAGIAEHAAGPAPAQAITIRIDLQGHGAVHVRLALNGNALSLRMRADREEIAEQLRQDHLKLSDTLSAAGYDTEIVAIEGRRNDVAPLSGSDVASAAGTGADGAANADRGADGENRRPTARQPQEPNQGFGESLSPHEQEDHETRNIAQRRAGALYV